jgi:diguanylate cyclase (GGDEF)-like protein
MIDVDLFKTYNDAFGHPAGDVVLQKVAEILRESTRDVDCVSRYGGEEFCVVLPETPGDAAGQIAERIRSRVAAETFSGRKVTVSIGVAAFPANGDTPETVVTAADTALYAAKAQGRNRVAYAETKRSGARKTDDETEEKTPAEKRGSGKKRPATGGRRGSG